MNPVEQYEAQQRALETERFARIAKALEEDAKQPANFCSSHDADEVNDARWEIVIACAVSIIATSLIAWLAGWILPIVWSY